MNWQKTLKDSWHHIRRSPYYSLAAILVMSLTLFVVGVFGVTIFGSSKLLAYFESRPQVVAFLSDEVTKQEADEIAFRLMATGKAQSVAYVSKEEALGIYRELIKDDPLLLEMVTADILPASLEISARQITDLGFLAEVLSEEAGVEEVGFQQEVVQSLEKIIVTIRRAGLVVVIFLVLVSILVTLVVVGMKASARRREIKIMRLVGATAAFVRIPFLLEGIFYGLVSALASWCAVVGLMFWVRPFLDGLIVGLDLLPISWLGILLIFGGQFIVGVFLGGVGSLIAVKRYLR